jgi:hypothetical protein
LCAETVDGDFNLRAVGCANVWREIKVAALQDAIGEVFLNRDFRQAALSANLFDGQSLAV